MVTLFVDSFEKRYTARLFTCQTFTVVVLFLATIVLPYIIVYITQGMWVKEN